MGRARRGNISIKGIYTNARDETSYRIIRSQLESLGKKLGYEFEFRELGSARKGNDVMHDVLIVPRRNGEHERASVKD